MLKVAKAGFAASSGEDDKSVSPVKKIIITEQRLNRIKARMAEKGIPQAALADKIGISPSAISFILSGRTRRTQYFPALADALGVELDWLLGKRGGEFDEDQLEDGEHLLEKAQIVRVPEIDLRGQYTDTLKGIPIAARRHTLGRPMLEHYTTAAPEDVVVAVGTGDAMAPTILTGDLLFIDISCRQLDSLDAIWLIRFAGLLAIRRVRATRDGLRLIADRAQLSDEDVSAEDVEFLGKLVGISRRV